MKASRRRPRSCWTRERGGRYISPVAGKAQLLEHLYSDYTEPIRDPLWRHIYLSPGLEAITATPAFQKLARIKQLGPTFLVYPGATHTRLAHSLGVFHLARRILTAILLNEAAPEISGEGAKAFLCAALLHDLGHFPFAHSLKELPVEEHERLTAALVLTEPIGSLIKTKLGAPPELVAAIVDRRLDSPTDAVELRLFRNILSGVLDPDKLDYLSRDAYFCGVPYGIQDTDFIIDKIRPDSRNGIAIDEQGISAVENILFSRYLMYRSVYWHRTVRIATAMIKKAVYLSIQEGVLRAEQLYGLDDEEFFSLFDSIAFPPARLVQGVFERRLFKSIAEEPFTESLSSHRALLDLDARRRKEKELAIAIGNAVGTKLSEESIIIDIPEPISFEIDLPVRSGEATRPFLSSESVFDSSVIESFACSLRRLRIVASPEIAGLIPEPGQILTWL